MIEKTKVCTKCGISKPINEFYRDKRNKLEIGSACKLCRKKEGGIYYKNNKEKMMHYNRIHHKEVSKKAYMRHHEYCKENPEKIYVFGIVAFCVICERVKANIEKIKSRKALYYTAHKEQISIRAAIYNKAHKKETSAQKAIYYKNHKDEAKLYKAKHVEERRAYVNKRHKANPKLRLNHSISAGIQRSLKGNKKGAHWEDLVGYTIEKLKKHLEKQFVNGMTWDNYGEWHLEHKFPISVYNFTESNHRDFIKCWALKNLQPMWAQENISKGVRLTKHFQPSLLL